MERSKVSETGFHVARFDVVAPPGLPEPPVSRTAVHVVRRSRDGQHAGSILAVGRGGWLHQAGDGLFATPPLPPGVYDLYYRRYLSTSIGVLSFQIVDDDVDAGTMVLRPLVPVRGVVTGPTGIVSNYGDVMVVLKPLDGWSQALMLPGVMRPDTAGVFASPDDPGGVSEGRYRAALLGLPPDVYVAAMRHGGLEIGDDGLRLSAATAGHRLDILLDGPGGIVEGTVHDRRAEAVPFSQVVLAPARDRRQNADLFRASVSDETGVTVDGSDISLAVHLEGEAGALEGLVVGKDGREVSAAIVALIPEDPTASHLVRDTRTTRAGRFAFESLTPGPHRLYAWRELDGAAYRNAAFMNRHALSGQPVTVAQGARLSTGLVVLDP